jgi:tetratricopeptide (TPR) repeat protein
MPSSHALWDKDRSRRYSSGADVFAEIETLRSSPTPAAYRFEEREPDPVFGRDHELQKLGDLLGSALERRGTVVLIAGEPGIGKTSLTRNFVFSAQRRHPELIFARGSCIEQYGTGEAYLPFLDAVGSLLQGPRKARVIELLRTHAPTWCLQFPAIFSTSAMDQILREVTGASRDRMLRELGDGVVALASEMPLLLVLEDMHWADPASVDLLRHLAERARAHRILLLATARPEDIERNNPSLKKCYAEMHARSLCAEIALTTLSVKDFAQYLEAHFAPNAFPDDLAAMIHRKSEGHPLFATGAVQILVERGNLARENGAWKLAVPLSQLELDVPVTVRSMIEKKVALLTDDQRQTLQYASIEGEVFTSAVLGALLEADELELEERLDKISKGHRLIQTEGEEELPDGSLATVYRFSHALYQNFLYDQLLTKRKALLHRRAGEILERAYAGESGRVAGALATHFERGRDFEKAIRYLIDAGGTALSRYANTEAVAHFAHGLDLIDKLQEGQRAALQAMLLQKRAQALTALGQLVAAGVDYRAMRDTCRASGDQVNECRALIGICTVAFNARDVESMETFNPQARALAEQVGNETLMADANVAWAMYKMVSGSLLEAKTSFQKAIPTARRLNYRPAMVLGLTYEGILEFWHTDYAKAEALQVEACGLAEQARDGFYLALALYYLGLTRANLGRIGEAMVTMHEALDLAKRNNNALALSRVPNGIGWVWREIGNLSKAIEFNEGCVEVTQRTKAAEAEANALINLVYDYLEADLVSEAAGALERIHPLYEREKWKRWRFYGVRHSAARAQYGLARMDLDRAEEHARVVLTNAQANRVGKYTGIAHRLLGEIAAARGDANDAELAPSLSLQAFAEHPAPLIEWRTHASMGRLLAARNRPAEARESFARAAQIVEKLAASLSDPTQRANFLEMPAAREVIGAARLNR